VSRWRWAALGLLGLLVASFAAHWVRVPGYMDADYYDVTARSLAGGQGFSETFLWNYLDDPPQVPHPSHLYWMPLASVLAAGGMTLFGTTFRAAQLPFVLLAGFLPPLTALISLRMTPDPRRAWLSGWFAALPGFFLPYWVTTDTFAVYAVAGAVALWALAEATSHADFWRWLLAGALVGLCHLTRADGVLLLVPGLLAVGWSGRRRLASTVWLLAGYAAVMSPWWIRNLMVAGSMMPGGGGRTLWLLGYDELFSYPASILTPGRWWAAGPGAILGVRSAALWSNLKSLVAVNGLVFLGPLMALGAWRLRKQRLVQLALVYLTALLLVMSFVFPFAGTHGGFFHSSVALMPILWPLGAIGLEMAVAWGSRRRRWSVPQALRVFGIGALVLAGLLTAGLSWRRVVGSTGKLPQWEASYRTYVEVGNRLRELDSGPGLVAVNNPPGFTLASGLPSVVVPNGPPEALRQVVDRYRVAWIVLDENRPAGLSGLYGDPASVGWLSLAETLLAPDGSRILLFRVGESS
jgi:hypothetical protein